MSEHPTEKILEAMAERVKFCTGALVRLDRGEQFSGVFFRHEGGHFLLSAKHCLTGVTAKSQIRIITQRNQTNEIDLARAGRLLHPKVDAAILGLEEPVANHLEVDWLELDSISSNDAQPGALVCAYGFPAQFSKLESNPVKTMTVIPHVYGTKVSSRWPKEELRYPATRETDLFIERDSFDTLGKGNMVVPYYSPEGMSGCGVFAVPRPEKNTIWAPSQAKLVGLLISVIEKDKLIRCVRIEHVLTLLGFSVEIQGERYGSS